MALRSGYTTGTCAAAAAKAAAMVLSGCTAPEEVAIILPDGDNIVLPVRSASLTDNGAMATIIKDAGDDPDITNGAAITVFLSWADNGEVHFRAGEGVGVVTKTGLSVPPGEPAINPVPRSMIRDALRSVTNNGVVVTVSIEGGQALAQKTFNPRLGIEGGLSILGTTGRVRPFSCSAVKESVRLVIEVAAAAGVTLPVVVPGHIGARAARKLFNISDEQIIEVSNEWGFALDAMKTKVFKAILVMGHPGKLAKLAQGQWDTHSSRSPGAQSYAAAMSAEETGRTFEDAPTVEGVFEALTEKEKRKVGDRLAKAVKEAVERRLAGLAPVSCVLVDMKGRLLGSEGDVTPWQ